MSGNSTIDRARSYLMELALMFAREHLKPGGHFWSRCFRAAIQCFPEGDAKTFTEVLSRKQNLTRPQQRNLPAGQKSALTGCGSGFYNEKGTVSDEVFCRKQPGYIFWQARAQ